MAHDYLKEAIGLANKEGQNFLRFFAKDGDKSFVGVERHDDKNWFFVFYRYLNDNGEVSDIDKKYKEEHQRVHVLSVPYANSGGCKSSFFGCIGYLIRLKEMEQIKKFHAIHYPNQRPWGIWRAIVNGVELVYRQHHIL